jgi:hypothetical protein
VIKDSNPKKADRKILGTISSQYFVNFEDFIIQESYAYFVYSTGSLLVNKKEKTWNGGHGTVLGTWRKV